VKEAAARDYEELFGEILTYYDFGKIGDSHVIVVETEMGSGEPGATHAVVAAAIQELRLGIASGRRSACVIAVGIAFGMDETKQAIGDVLVATHLRNYERERVGASSTTPRGSRAPTSTKLTSRIRAAGKRLPEIEVRFGPVLSGEKLVDNLEYREELKKLEPEAIGGEMEGSGVLAACHERVAHWLVVKAICDWGDGNKAKDKDARQKLAATLVFAALEKGGFTR
jgi:nucleoside phosphorylase